MEKLPTQQAHNHLSNLKKAFDRLCNRLIEPFVLNSDEGPLWNNFFNYLFEEGIYPKEKGLLVRGSIGCGKTTMFKVAEFFRYRYRKFKVVPVSQVVTYFNKNGDFGPYAIKEWCFDDLGTEIISNYFGVKTEAISALILIRYDLWKNYGVRTHFTSNLDNKPIEDRYGPRAYSRLKEMTSVINYPYSEDRRGQSKTFFHETPEKIEKKLTDQEKKESIIKMVTEDFVLPYEESLNTGKLLVKRLQAAHYYLKNYGLLKSTNSDVRQSNHESNMIVNSENYLQQKKSGRIMQSSSTLKKEILTRIFLERSIKEGRDLGSELLKMIELK